MGKQQKNQESEKDFSYKTDVPQHIISELSQYSKGFMLFYCDEDLNPRVVSHLPSDFVSIGLVSFSRMWTNSLANLQDDIINSEVRGDTGEAEETE